MKAKILLADDDEPVRKMVMRVLETAGYCVLPANTAYDAKRILQAERPDLVLLDLKLPDLAGWEAFDDITRGHPTPMIVITTWPNQQELARQRGIDTLMEKPLDLPTLLRTIQELLASSRKRQARLQPSPQLANTAT